MWVPIGGFAIGYLAIILVFAGFGGMLERFLPGSFAGAAGAGLGDWIAFSFYAAIAEPYSASPRPRAPPGCSPGRTSFFRRDGRRWSSRR